MWDDIIISKKGGHQEKGTSAITCFAIKGDHGISENRISYWISDSFLGFGMTIFKDTPEGVHLKNLIDKSTPLSQINSYLSKLILKKASPSSILKKVKEAEEKAYKKGKRDKAKELREVLEVREF